MTALQKLQEKIEQWRVAHEAIKSENATLKVELMATKKELEDKDNEIEKIIAQVETLLNT